MHKLIKDLKIKSPILFNLFVANNTILSCFSFFFLIVDLHFLILAAIKQIFNLTAELIIPVGVLTKEAKVEIETHPVAVNLRRESVQ